MIVRSTIKHKLQTNLAPRKAMFNFGVTSRALSAIFIS